MIIGIGNDLIDIKRIEALQTRYGKRFLNRVFTPHEQATAQATANSAASFAKRFAAKEAFVKALGTGIINGISWQDIEVVNLDSGQPVLKISGGAEKYLKQLLPAKMKPQIHLSLSDTKELAQAFVTIAAIK